MIKIKIDNPDKLASNVLIKKSAFVSFDYDGRIVDFIKKMGTRIYNPDNRTWEMPINNIVSLCNKFEDIEIIIEGFYEDLHKIELENDIPKNIAFKTKPFPHQLDGIRFGLNHDRFLLCDDQGLGKTLQIIDLVECLGEKVKKALIICGVNSLKYNWREEVSKHSNEKGYVLGTRYRKNGKEYLGSTKDKINDLSNLPDNKYIITNIETLRLGAKKIGKYKYDFPIANKIKELCNDGTIGLIAFDECHRAKDSTSLQGKAMLEISAPHMIAMSGTPLMNSPIDLYFPIKWLGYENHSLFEFKRHYCRLGGYNDAEILGYKNLDELRSLVDQIMLRRLKTEVLDLPDKIEKLEYVEMSSKQSKLYLEIQENTKTLIHQIRMSNNPLSMLLRLRQVTGWCGIIDESIQESAKMQRMVELVEDIAANNQKAIIFSNWTSITEVAVKLLSKYNPAYITGDVKQEERMNEVDRFQNDERCKVIIGTIGAMGTGLTLTSAQNVIFLDEPWTKALKDQAEDRAHRIGTKWTVSIITLMCKDTIDDRIHDLIEKKGKMSDAIIDGKLSLEDINFLLS
jgi:SNF2 family DNA or RNA helicase